MDPQSRSKLKRMINTQTSAPMAYKDIRSGDDPQLDQMDTWDAKQTSGSNNPGSGRFKKAVKNFLDPGKNIKGENKTKKTRTSGANLDSSPASKSLPSNAYDANHFWGHESRKPGTQTTKTNVFGTKVTRTKYDDGESAVFKERKSGKKILKTKNTKVAIADDASKGYMLAKSKITTKQENTTPQLKYQGDHPTEMTTTYTTKNKYKKGSVAKTAKKDKSKTLKTIYTSSEGKVIGSKVQQKGMSKWTKDGYQRRSATSGDRAKGDIKKIKSKMHTSFDSFGVYETGQQNAQIAAAKKTTKYK